MRRAKGRPALFLDRDGVLLKVEMGKYVLSPDDIQWIPGSLEAVKSLAVYDIDIVVVSNQQCVGLGLLDHKTLDVISSNINHDCEHAIRAFYYCTHKKTDGCHCRKPQVGLFAQAMRDLDIDPRKSIMVGDTQEDMLAARMAGIYPIFVLTGIGEAYAKDIVFDDLAGATNFIGQWFRKIFDE